MRAITIVPGQADSVALSEVAEPAPEDGSLLVSALQLGVCGTDFELISGHYGSAPVGSMHLVLGHESFGRVEEAPETSGFQRGDLVIGIVRRPDPEPCTACAAGEWDMCRNGSYTERGIIARHGFGAERWRIEPEFTVRVEPDMRPVGVLVEPASVIAKAWDQIEHIGQRAHWRPRSLLVTGAGPIGLLAAMMGRQRGFEVHVLDQVRDGPKPRLVEQLGATYNTGTLDHLGSAPDIVIECTGAAPLIRDCILHLASAGILCLVGSSQKPETMLNVGDLNRAMVLKNQVIFGVVNGNRRHYEQAAEALRQADRNWLLGLITRREPFAQWRAAFERRAGDVKVVIDLDSTD
jgi:threonine dehydrogenase-like Zn-dependent dehydrogenase